MGPPGSFRWAHRPAMFRIVVVDENVYLWRVTDQLSDVLADHWICRSEELALARAYVLATEFECEVTVW